MRTNANGTQIVGAAAPGAAPPGTQIMVVCTVGGCGRVHKAVAINDAHLRALRAVPDDSEVFSCKLVGGDGRHRRLVIGLGLKDENITWGRGWWEGELLASALLSANALARRRVDAG